MVNGGRVFLTEPARSGLFDNLRRFSPWADAGVASQKRSARASTTARLSCPCCSRRGDGTPFQFERTNPPQSEASVQAKLMRVYQHLSYCAGDVGLIGCCDPHGG